MRNRKWTFYVGITVIDPEMTGELRVTVVATGLGNAGQLSSGESVKLVVNKTSSGEVDYEQLERPTVIRNKVAADKYGAEASEGSMEYLDIPAFLRRQAD